MAPSLRLEQLVIRPLQGYAEMAACVSLQRVIWGAEFDQTVPPAILWAAQRTGGIASGAFAPDGSLAGFVFGISGVEGNRLVHWSDMLAVRPDARGIGLGIALKLHQRQVLLERGIEVVYWTFDPLEARNAHINFRRLGVVAREYLRDVYGETGSELHAGIGTDRLVAEWHIRSSRVAERLKTVRSVEGAATGTATSDARGDDAATGGTREALTAAPEAIRISVPLDIQALKRAAPAAAAEHRRVTREAFEHYLGRGYLVVDAERAHEALHYRLVPLES
ncbi:MAG TPA: hypothetical protein VMN78_10255 [Longimicrobiales bacterium]|nr:hypothetical protein [Longimicrobiales bacterium]